MDGAGALTVSSAALATALATGLGSVPFLVVGRLARSWVGVADALAAGFMLAASALLFYTGARENTPRMIGGALIGVLFVAGGLAAAVPARACPLRCACGRRRAQGDAAGRRDDRAFVR